MPAMPLSQVAVQLRPNDNVAVAARNLAEGMDIELNGSTLHLKQRVGLGHKLALQNIKKGEAIYKYGQIIGFAREDIPAGSHVHVHNVAADAFERDYAFCRDCPPPGANATGQAIHLIEHQGLIQLNGSRSKPHVITVQECGGIRKTVDAGVQLIAEMLPR